MRCEVAPRRASIRTWLSDSGSVVGRNWPVSSVRLIKRFKGSKLMSQADIEKNAGTPVPVHSDRSNPQARIPYGCTIEHIRSAMTDYVEFLGFINTQLHTKGMQRLESFLMPANSSSMVGEFMTSSISRHCATLVKNKYHNGHPDLLPQEMFPEDSILHAPDGIEIKASRYARGWQGHNPEDVRLMVFVFDCNRPTDPAKNLPPRPFRFVKVVGAEPEKSDWQFSGRSSTSRRTITASITKTGFAKMEANWIYRATGRA